MSRAMSSCRLLPNYCGSCSIQRRYKSVAAFFGTRQRLARPGWSTHVAVAGSDIKMPDHLKVIPVTLDLSMTLDTQVTATVKDCNFHLQSLRQLRSSLPRDVAQSFACAIIGSRLEYCNFLYYGMSNTNFRRLQTVQNAAARIVCQASLVFTRDSICYSAYMLSPVRPSDGWIITKTAEVGL